MTKSQLNNLRLFVKLLVTAWVPVGVLLGLIPWDATTSTVVMGASTVTIDAGFRIWGVEDSPAG